MTTPSETPGTVVLEMSMSLDGFIAGTDIGEARPTGDEGEQLHDWMFRDKTETEARASQDQSFEDVGAVVIGRRTFDLGLGPWGDNPAFHAPCFVISREAQPTISREGGTSYIFVTGGAKRAGAEARAAAGDKQVQVMGGAGAAQQCPRAGSSTSCGFTWRL